MKLVTTFAALDLLGPDYRWKTEAYLGGPLVDGVLHGDLILKGYGDPKITVEQWQSFIAQLRAKGLAAVDGDLVLDRSRFALVPYDPAAFDHDPLKPYNVGPDALLVNFKSLRLTLGTRCDGGRSWSCAPTRRSPTWTLGAAPVLAGEACDDWRLRAAPAIDDRGDRGAISFGGTLSARLRRARLVDLHARSPALRPRDVRDVLPRGRRTLRRRRQGAGGHRRARRSPCSNRRRSTTSSAMSTSCPTT